MRWVRLFDYDNFYVTANQLIGFSCFLFVGEFLKDKIARESIKSFVSSSPMKSLTDLTLADIGLSMPQNCQSPNLVLTC